MQLDVFADERDLHRLGRARDPPAHGGPLAEAVPMRLEPEPAADNVVEPRPAQHKRRLVEDGKGAVFDDAVGSTLQKRAIFCRRPSSSGSSQRATMMSGMMPIPCSSRTECWVGLDLCSPELLR